MEYKIIGHCIVGGGMTGIYNALLFAHKIKKNQIKKEKIVILEKTSILGGHIYTGKFKKVLNPDNSPFLYEAGGARFCKLHINLINLIHYAYFNSDITDLNNVDQKIEKLEANSIITKLENKHQYYGSKSEFQNYFDNNDDNQTIQKLRDLWKKVSRNEKLYKKQYLITTLEIEYGSEFANHIRNSFGYDSEFLIQNTYDSLQLFSKEEYYLNSYYIMTNGFNELLEKLKQKLFENNIKVYYNCNIEFFTRLNIIIRQQIQEEIKKQQINKKQQLEKKFNRKLQEKEIKQLQEVDNKKSQEIYNSFPDNQKEELELLIEKHFFSQFEYNYLINSIYKKKDINYYQKRKLIIRNIYWCLNPTYFSKVFNKFYNSASDKLLYNIFNKIKPISLHRLYIAVDKELNQNDIIINDSIIRMFIPCGKGKTKDGQDIYVYMIYCDGYYSDILKDMKDVNNENDFKDIIVKLLNKSNINLTDTNIIEIISEHWKEGVHFNCPNDHEYNSSDLYNYLINGKIDDFPYMFICGEAYSKRQGWIEGGLEMAKDLTEKIYLENL